MKINTKWELKDITAGLLIIKNTSPIGSSDYSFARTVIFLLGYTNQSQKIGGYGLINNLTDGWFFEIGTKEEVLEYLNKNDFRPLRKEEYINIISNKTQGFIL